MHFITDHSKGILGKPNPDELWEEIMDQLPNDVFDYKPEKKFLFPAVGHGTEVKVMIQHLKEHCWTKEQIINAFYIVDKYHAFTNPFKKMGFVHVYTRDFLELDIKDKDGEIMKFDVVVGNPPYQKIKEDGSRCDKGSNLWTEITRYALENLSNIVAFITPSSWLTLADDSAGFRMATEYKEHFKCINVAECAKHFNVGSTFTYFIIDKNKKYSNTNLILPLENCGINFSKVNTLPYTIKTCNNLTRFANMFSKYYNTFWNKRDTIGCYGQGSISYFRDGTPTNLQNVKSSKNDTGTYLYYNTAATRGKTLPGDIYISKEDSLDPNFQYTGYPSGKWEKHNVKHPAQDIPKVLISLSGKYNPILDDKGMYGYGAFVAPILCKSQHEAKKVYEFLILADVIELIDILMRHSGMISINSIKFLKNIIEKG